MAALSEASTERITVRLEADLRAEIERVAAQEKRTTSNMIRFVLSDWADMRRRFQPQEAA